MKWFKEKSLVTVGFLQATAVALYCLLIGLLIINGEQIFGTPDSFLGPAMFLVLFVVSALVVALFTLAYPIMLFWDEKKTKEALKLIGYTVIWLIFYIVSIMVVLSLI